MSSLFEPKDASLRVDRALRRAVFSSRGHGAIICHRAAERSIHLKGI